MPYNWGFVFIVFSFLRGVDAQIDNSFCRKSTGTYVKGNVECSDGEVYLRGQYVEVGIHRVGSYGTSFGAPSGSAYAGRNLGFIADYGKDGWGVCSTTTPFCGKFAGDYFVPGSPVEGWLLRWTRSDGSRRDLMMEGLMGRFGMYPTTFQITSTPDIQSALWVGRSGELEVTKVTQFGNNNLYFTTSVKLQNIGTSVITNVYYMRTVDPDQEQPWSGWFTTDNYVKYQPRADDGSDAAVSSRYVHPSIPSVALVIAIGINNANYFLGLGSMNKGRATHYGFFESDPAFAFGASGGTSDWKYYGGNDMTTSMRSRMRRQDQAIHLTFKFDSIKPGEIVQFDLAHVLTEADLLPALASLQAIKITQPTSTISGESVLFSAATNMTISKCDFFVFAKKISSGLTDWYLVGSTTTAASMGTYSIRFDSYQFADGAIQLKAVGYGTGSAPPVIQTSIGSVIGNAGTVMVFTTSDLGGTYAFYKSVSTSLSMTKKISSMVNPDSISYFREIYFGGEVLSSLILTTSTAPYTVSVSVSDLSVGQSISVRARVSSNGGVYTTTTMFSGVVTKLNQAPTDILLSATRVTENSGMGVSIGVLSTVDVDTEQSHTYSLVDSAAGRFAISGNTLVVNGPIDYEATKTLTIRVRVSDGQPANCCFEKSFTITVLDVNEAPTSIAPLSFTIAESASVGTLLGTFVTLDPDDGQTISYSFLTPSASFSVHSSNGQFRTAGQLNFEAVSRFDLVLHAVDNGVPSLFLDRTITVLVTDVNEAPSALSLTCSVNPCSVEENSPIGTVVGTLVATDEDAGDVQTYTLPGTAGGLFAVNPSTGVVTVAKNIDYEQLGLKVTITGRTTDSGGLSKTVDFTIIIINLPEPPSSSGITCFVNEDRRAGETVTAVAGGTSLCFIDAASVDGSSIEFEILSGAATTPGGVPDIYIQSCSGIFFLNRTIDYEVHKLYNISVQVTTPGGISYSRAIINVVDVNDAPVFSPGTRSVNENSAVGTLVGGMLSPLVYDQDTLTSPPAPFCCDLLFSIEGGNSAGFFSLQNAATGQLQVARTGLNFESVNVYVLTMRVVDEGGLSSTTTVTVNIVDVNEAPRLTFSSGTFATIPENSVVNTQTGIGIYATDEDIGQTVTVTITSGNTNNAFKLISTFDSTFGLNVYHFAVNNAAAIDFEAITSFTLGLTATDNGSPVLTGSQSYVISVLDVNEAPTITASYSFSIAENSPAGTVVGVPLKGGWSDPDFGDTTLFSVTNYGGDSGKTFSVSATDGTITLALSFLNFELTPSFVYTIRVTDKGGLSATTVVTITVLNVPEPPVFGALFVGGINENVPAKNHSFVMNVDQALLYSARDDDNDPLTFKVVSVDRSRSKAYMFYTVQEGSAVTTKIAANATFNYEVKNSYLVNISVTDGTFTVYAETSILINDVNDRPVIPATATCYLSEDAVVGSEICTLVATDEDFISGSLWGKLNYTLGSPVTGLAVRTTSNVGTLVFTNAALVASPSTVATVVVTDGGGLSAACTVTIVRVVSNKAPRCSSKPMVFYVAENTLQNTVVGTIFGSNSTLFITDDTSAPMTAVIIAGNTNSHFRLNRTTGVLSVNTGALINFEVLASYSMAVRITETGSEPLSTTCNLDVIVTDVNEPTTFPPQSFQVDENIFPGLLTRGNVAINRVYVIDEDPADQNGAFSISCLSCKDNPVQIDSVTGELTLKSGFLLNFEAFPVYTYTGTWSNRGVTKTATITISLVDVPESPVVYASTFDIDETATVLTVGQVNAMDPDFEGIINFATTSCRDNCGLKYYIQSGSPYLGQFVIDINTGIISVNSVDYENSNNFTFVVRAVDASGLASTNTVKVNIADRPDCTVNSLVNISGTALRNARTSGGDTLIVYGTNFGPTKYRMSAQGLAPSITTITASLQSAASSSASSFLYSIVCNVNYTGSQDNTMLTCRTPVGVGRDLGLLVTVTTRYPGYTSVCTAPFSAGKMSYAPPSIASVQSASAIKTNGQSVVTINGNNFGRALNSFVQATFSNSFVTRTVTCSVVTDHEVLSCPTSSGLGSGISWVVTVGSQRSGVYASGSYAKPNITSVSSTLLNTVGGDSFTITGTDFGNVREQLFVTYGLNTGLEYTATSCQFVTQHISVTCASVAGIGKNLKVVVRVGDLTSKTFSSTGLSYRPPVLTSVSGPGSSAANTAGGDIIYLAGLQFGPITVSPDDIVVQYGKHSNPRQYTASSCKITSASTRIECVTVPGTGVDLVWSVTIAGQQSSVLEANTSYGPPVISAYAGEGAVNAATSGNETVIIRGRNFGPSIAYIQEVSYSSFNGTKFVTTSTCSMQEAHHVIRCYTVPGAGSEMTWSIIVDGQYSVSPSTSYGVPTVTRVSSPRINNGSVYGGDVLVISGTNFGPADAFVRYGVHFLDSVTYGPSGVEYQATGCVVISDIQLQCNSIKGVGSNLVFKVTVAGQESPTSSAVFSYAPPVLSSLSPSSVSTNGVTKATLRGVNFAIFSLPKLYFAGSEVLVTYVSETQLQFTVPEATSVTSVSNDVLLVVGDQVSNILTISYNAPYITSVSTIDGVNGTLYLIVEGTSFSLNPEVLVYDLEAEFFSFASCSFRSHNEVNCVTSAKKGNVTIIAGPQRSNVGFFEFGPPRVLSIALSGGARRTVGYTAENPAVVTVTGQNFGEASSNAYVYFENRNSLNSTVCAFVSYRKIDKTENSADWAVIAASVDGEDPTLGFEQITCQLPPGQGLNNSIKVIRGSSTSLGCGCNGCSSKPCFDYLPPRLDGMVVGGGSTQGGYEVQFTGDNFGLEQTVTVGGREWDVIVSKSTHTTVFVAAPAGEGKDLLVNIMVDGQSTGSSSSRRLAAGGISFSYSPPDISTYLAPIIVGTDGSSTLTTIYGSNFGIYGPIVYLGSVLVSIHSFNHTQIKFFIPPGQGSGLTLSVTVSGQTGYAPDTLSYVPPSITSVSPLACDTSGGRATNVTMTMLGSNFGAVDKDWILSFGSVTVPLADIISFSSTKIVFYAPEGQGSSLPISIRVGGQPNSGTTFYFNYNPPVIQNLVLPADVNTRGGFPITFQGRSFGKTGAYVTVKDPKYDENSLDYRMPSTECPLVSQDHTLIVCRIPPGAGVDLILTIKVGSSDDNTATFNFSYSPPRISFFHQSKGGDAAGGERLKIYGENFGAFRTPLNITIGKVLCPKAVWLADDPVFKFQPYLQCETPRMTVGVKNISVAVAYQKSPRVDIYKVTCKVGFFGGDGEFCTSCGDPELTGLVCLTDNLYTPYAYNGFYMTQARVPSSSCSAESQQLRSTCPASLPCMPKEACLGNNTCEAAYVGERCATCAEGYYKINGECQVCPEAPWMIPVAIGAVLAIVAYIARKLSQKNVSLGILSIGVDYFQVLGVFATAKVKWPSSLVWLFNAVSSINFNIDVVAPECYNHVSIPYRTKWIIITALPIITIIAFTIVFSLYSGYLYFVKHRKRGFQEPLYKAFAFYLMIFYYAYLMLSNNTLAVFNCQPTEPSDGYRYMVAVGADGGRCYKDGTLQQELEPWAILAFIVYSIGFPVFIGFMLYTNRQKAISDQLMKASGKSFSEAEAFNILKFRMIFSRMYYQFKPQYYFWILWILARKFCLSVSAIIFRENVVFLLALYLLVLFTSYTLEVRYLPYMSTSEYDQVLEDNAHLITENLQEVIIKSSVRTKEKYKAARLGQNDPLIKQIAPKLDFFNNYNTVEAYMLISAILVNIAALMFESDELSGAQTDSLTYSVILIVVVSIIYFAWVLFSELWVAFYPNTPLPLLCIKPPEKKDEEEKLEEVDFVKFEESVSATSGPEKTSDSAVKLQMKLESAEQMIQEQQAEIARLKKGNSAAVHQAFAAPAASGKAKPKLKKEFSSGGEFEMQANPLQNRSNPMRAKRESSDLPHDDL